MRQIDATALRGDLYETLKNLRAEGSAEVLRNGRVVAIITPPPMTAEKPQVDRRRLARVCTRCGIRRLALFGPILRDDFGPDSTVGILVDVKPGKLDTMVELHDAIEDLTDLFGRDIELLDRSNANGSADAVKILATAQVIYEA